MQQGTRLLPTRQVQLVTTRPRRNIHKSKLSNLHVCLKQTISVCAHTLLSQLKGWISAQGLDFHDISPLINKHWEIQHIMRRSNSNLHHAISICKVWACRMQGNIAWLVRLVDVNSVEAAESYRGLTLGMLAVDRPDLESDDEFYVQDLVGMQVRPQQHPLTPPFFLDGGVEQ